MSKESWGLFGVWEQEEFWKQEIPKNSFKKEYFKKLSPFALKLLVKYYYKLSTKVNCLTNFNCDKFRSQNYRH